MTKSVLAGIVVSVACFCVFAIVIAVSAESGKPGAASVLLMLGAFFISPAIGWFVGKRHYRQRSGSTAPNVQSTAASSANTATTVVNDAVSPAAGVAGGTVVKGIYTRKTWMQSVGSVLALGVAVDGDRLTVMKEALKFVGLATGHSLPALGDWPSGRNPDRDFPGVSNQDVWYWVPPNFWQSAVALTPRGLLLREGFSRSIVAWSAIQGLAVKGKDKAARVVVTAAGKRLRLRTSCPQSLSSAIKLTAEIHGHCIPGDSPTVGLYHNAVERAERKTPATKMMDGAELEPVSAPGVMLKKGEKIVWFDDECGMVELKGEMDIGAQMVAVPLIPGSQVTAYVQGLSRMPVFSSSLKAMDTGKLVVTNQRLIFHGFNAALEFKHGGYVYSSRPTALKVQQLKRKGYHLLLTWDGEFVERLLGWLGGGNSPS